MSPRRRRSASIPIAIGIFSVALAIAMLVAWILVLVYSDIGQTWLLVLGIISLSFILLVLAGFAVMLVLEQREIRRQFGFIDSVTHELKSPLAGLKLSLETLAREDLPEGATEHLRGMMHGDVERLTAFIDDVLTANRLGHARQVQRVDTELSAVVQRAVERVRSRHELHDHEITVSVPPDLRMTSDPTALETIVRNLVDNAVKYSDPPVQVHINAELLGNGRQLRLRIADHGIGFAPHERRRALHRFYRADREAVRRRPGTGLGLFVVQALVSALGGRLRLDSAGENQGTTVHVQLPTGNRS
ncbi:MAG: HAMP domain-containing histidine kinase [Myxococcales bacterium]|nr:HAMP domain-containing histidine kinase [Myxococcales bacterium]